MKRLLSACCGALLLAAASGAAVVPARAQDGGSVCNDVAVYYYCDKNGCTYLIVIGPDYPC